MTTQNTPETPPEGPHQRALCRACREGGPEGKTLIKQRKTPYSGIRGQGRKALAYDALITCRFREFISLSIFACDVRMLSRLTMFCMLLTCFSTPKVLGNRKPCVCQNPLNSIAMFMLVFLFMFARYDPHAAVAKQILALYLIVVHYMCIIYMYITFILYLVHYRFHPIIS